MKDSTNYPSLPPPTCKVQKLKTSLELPEADTKLSSAFVLLLNQINLILCQEISSCGQCLDQLSLGGLQD